MIRTPSFIIPSIEAAYKNAITKRILNTKHVDKKK